MTTGQKNNCSKGVTLPQIDVRQLPPPLRHARIFEALALLDGGETLILINDHDPSPLYRHLEALQPDTYSWASLEQGPFVWQIEIGRKPDAGCNCTCGTV